MTYTEFDIALKKHLASLTDDEQRTLAIRICKKLFFHYHAFHEKTAWGDPDVLLDAIAMCDRIGPTGHSGSELLDVIAKVDEITPDTSDFEDANLALNACVAIHYMLHFLLDGDAQHLYYVCTSFYDTVDAIIQEDGTLPDEEIDNHPLMVETRSQLLGSPFHIIHSI